MTGVTKAVVCVILSVDDAFKRVSDYSCGNLSPICDDAFKRALAANQKE